MFMHTHAEGAQYTVYTQAKGIGFGFGIWYAAPSAILGSR